MAKKNTTVVREAAFLMAAQLLCSVIGLVYRSPLHLIIGDAGDGYYQYAYEWYTIILLISSYSIPTAISKVMADRLAVRRYKDAQKVFRASLYYVLMVGGAGAVFAYFGAPLLLKGQPDAVLALRVLAPTIILSGILGCLRGYFQAQNTTFPTGVSRVVEQVVNALVSVGAAYVFTRAYVGDENLTGRYGAAGGTLGTGMGVVTGIVFMLFVYFVNGKTIRRNCSRDKKSTNETYRQVFRVIFLMVTPIIFATFIYNVSGIINQNIFTYLMLWRKNTPIEISRQYSLYSYRVRPILNIPIALSSATSTALIPVVASALAAGERKEAANQVNECMKLSTFIAIPAAVGLTVLSYPVIRILYPSGDIAGAARILSIGSISVIFSSLSTVTNGVLQGLGHPSIPVRNAAIALGVDVVVACLLVGVLNMGVMGILIANVVYALTVMVLNAYGLRRYLDYRHDLKRLVLQPFIAAGIMGVIVGAIYWIPSLVVPAITERYITAALLTAVDVLIGVLVYVVIYTRSTGMTDDEIRRLPMGTKILVVLRKLHAR